MFSTGDINEKQRHRTKICASAWLLFCSFLVSVTPHSPARAQEAACLPAHPQAIEISAVTPHLELRSADGLLLRLRGIEPPRGTKSDPELAEKARRRLLELVSGKALIAHVEEGEPDRWSRRLAQVAEAITGAKIDLSGILIRDGWARVDPATASPDCLDRLYPLEHDARTARRGIWADPDYGVLSPTNSADFSLRSGETVLIQGVLRSKGQWRTLTFLNFGRRGELSIVLSRKTAAALERSGRFAGGYDGKHIRARGLLQIRTSPRLEVFSPGAIEILPPAAMATHKN